VVLAAASAACSVLTSFDGFSGGGTSAEGGATEDAARDADSSGGETGASDSGPVDSQAPEASAVDSSVSDSGADAAPDASGNDSAPPDASGNDSAPPDAKTSWCGSQPGPLLFCDDFDESPLISGFDAVNQMNCTAQLQAGVYVSSPYAMNAMSKASMQTFDCGGIKTFPGQGAAGATYKLAFDVQPLTADYSAQSDAVAAVIRLTDPDGTLWALQFEPVWDTTSGVLSVQLSEDTQFADGAPERFNYTVASADLPFAAWTRVTLQLTVGPQNVPQTAQLFFGTTMIAAATLHPTTTNPTLSLLLGFSYVGPQNAAWSMLYDNVTFSAN
jgi:hypothetical protein